MIWFNWLEVIKWIAKPWAIRHRREMSCWTGRWRERPRYSHSFHMGKFHPGWCFKEAPRDCECLIHLQGWGLDRAPIWGTGAEMSPQRDFDTFSYSKAGPVWNITFSTMKENSDYLEERFSNISVDKNGFHCLLYIHIPRLFPQDSDCLGLGCCLEACIFKW